jgi:tetratricopeptide (TPR) repeat protein
VAISNSESGDEKGGCDSIAISNFGRKIKDYEPRICAVNTSIDPMQFVLEIQPLLEAKDLDGLLALLKSRWKPGQIMQIVRCGDPDARKVALLALGLIGTQCCTEELARQLQDPDPLINELAEHSLWTVWFRSGRNCQANRLLARGSEAMSNGKLNCARSYFDQAIELDPEFAEAYNQRAIAHYLQEQFKKSIADCKRATERMPFHFGAWAGMGHCYVHLEDHRRALECYMQALKINPHLDCVEEAVAELRKKLAET